MVSTLEYSQLQLLPLLLVGKYYHWEMYKINVFALCLAATFFCTYEMTKVLLKSHFSSSMATPFVFMAAATVGEVVSTMIKCRNAVIN